jgi:hypothetical protein
VFDQRPTTGLEGQQNLENVSLIKYNKHCAAIITFFKNRAIKAFVSKERFTETETRRCAWCDHERGFDAQAGQTHGICGRHYESQMLKIRQAGKVEKLDPRSALEVVTVS